MFLSLSAIAYHDDSSPWCEHNPNARAGIFKNNFEHLYDLEFHCGTLLQKLLVYFKLGFCTRWYVAQLIKIRNNYIFHLYQKLRIMMILALGVITTQMAGLIFSKLLITII